MNNKEKAKQTIAKLIDYYRNILDEDRVGSYNEANTRKNFILPFFEALEWNVYTEDIREEERALYALKGYKFDKPELLKFYKKFLWYKPVTKNPEFSQEEKELLQKLDKLEKVNEE